MYPTIKTHTCQTLSQNLHTPISHPTQRRCPSHHLHHRKLNLSPSHPAQRRWLPQETQPFLPAIQRSDDGSSLTFRPQETQPFLPAIQRSADGSSNSRESTQSSSPHQSPLPPVAPHPHHYLPPGTEQPGRRVPVGYDSAGGELILGWRKSALFLKSPLSERQQAASSDFLKTVLAEFRQPRSQPPTKPGANRHPSPRRPSSVIRHPPSIIHHKKRALPQPIQPAKNALLISISLQSYTIPYDQHTIPYDRIKYNS